MLKVRQVSELKLNSYPCVLVYKKTNLISLYMYHAKPFFSDLSMERDKFMSPIDAKEFGIIDLILDHPPKHGLAASPPTEKEDRSTAKSN